MNENDVKNYYLIFYKDVFGIKHFVCIVENEDVAIQFCKDFKDHYYQKREDVVDEKL